MRADRFLRQGHYGLLGCHAVELFLYIPVDSRLNAPVTRSHCSASYRRICRSSLFAGELVYNSY